jgi:cytochrome c oxidase assembly factor CtaG
MTGHMAEHLALTLLVAPALVLLLRALRPLRFLSRRAARALYVATWPPLGWLAFVGVQWVMHFTGIYEASLHSEWVHEAEHVAFLLSALLFWWAVLGPDHRLGAIGRAVYVLTGMPAMSLVGVILATDGKPRYRSYALEDEHAAGALMWSVGSLAMAAALVLGVWTWLQREERRALAREAYDA